MPTNNSITTGNCMFAVCAISGTRQRSCLPCAARQAHGKNKTHGKPPLCRGLDQQTRQIKLFAVCRSRKPMAKIRHTANPRQKKKMSLLASRQCLPCAMPGTRQNEKLAVYNFYLLCGKGAVTVRGAVTETSFFAVGHRSTRQSLCRMTEKWHIKRDFASCLSWRFVMCNTQ